MGVSKRLVFCPRIRAPRRHVSMTAMIRAPMRRGTQPPWNTLSRLAPRKTKSMIRSGTISAAAAQSGQFQYRHITIKAMIAVTTMVPVTAMP